AVSLDAGPDQRSTAGRCRTGTGAQPVQPGTGVESWGAAFGGEWRPGIGGRYFTAPGQQSPQSFRYSGGRSRTTSPAAGAAGRPAKCTYRADSDLAGTSEQS